MLSMHAETLLAGHGQPGASEKESSGYEGLTPRDIHIVNTPATSYVANPQNSTTGWTMARLRDDGLTLTTHTHLADHPWNGARDELAWRA